MVFANDTPFSVGLHTKVFVVFFLRFDRVRFIKQRIRIPAWIHPICLLSLDSFLA